MQWDREMRGYWRSNGRPTASHTGSSYRLPTDCEHFVLTRQQKRSETRSTAKKREHHPHKSADYLESPRRAQRHGLCRKIIEKKTERTFQSLKAFTEQWRTFCISFPAPMKAKADFFARQHNGRLSRPTWRVKDDDCSPEDSVRLRRRAYHLALTAKMHHYLSNKHPSFPFHRVATMCAPFRLPCRLDALSLISQTRASPFRAQTWSMALRPQTFRNKVVHLAINSPANDDVAGSARGPGNILAETSICRAHICRSGSLNIVLRRFIAAFFHGTRKGFTRGATQAPETEARTGSRRVCVYVFTLASKIISHRHVRLFAGAAPNVMRRPDRRISDERVIFNECVPNANYNKRHCRRNARRLPCKKSLPFPLILVNINNNNDIMGKRE